LPNRELGTRPQALLDLPADVIPGLVISARTPHLADYIPGDRLEIEKLKQPISWSAGFADTKKGFEQDSQD